MTDEDTAPGATPGAPEAIAAEEASRRVAATAALYRVALFGEAGDAERAVPKSLEAALPAFGALAPAPPVDEAVEILTEAGGPEAKKRLRRVAMRLATGPADVDTRSALLQRLGLQPEELFARVGDKIDSDHAPGDRLKATASRLVQQHPGYLATFDEVVSDIIGLSPQPDFGCRSTYPNNTSRYDAATGVSVLHGTVKARRSAKELARVFDPQSWSGCSDHFQDTFASDQDGKPVAAPPPGSPWDGHVHEHFLAQIAGLAVSSNRVVLKIETKWIKEGCFRVDYAIEKALEVNIWGMRPWGGPGIAVDDGYIEIGPDTQPEWSRIEVEKRLAIAGYQPFDGILTMLSTTYLLAAGDELGDFACCGV